jgi:DNA-binding HxlR family transcriptional regulator
MKLGVGKLNRAFENRVRLGIMAALAVREDLEFTGLKQMLEVTDGNLASHMTVLEQLRFVRVRKDFVGRKPRTRYTMTETGRKAFGEHLDALERIIRAGQ